MTTLTRLYVNKWHTRFDHCTWDSTPTALDIYCRFIGNYGFLMHGGFGWVRVHTLNFATQLMDSRRNSGNWINVWRHRAYAK